MICIGFLEVVSLEWIRGEVKEENAVLPLLLVRLELLRMEVEVRAKLDMA